MAKKKRSVGRPMGKYKTPIQKKRLACGLTQAEVSSAVGLSPRHYQTVEQYRVIPGVLKAIKIAIVLRTSVETLWRDALDD